MVVIDTSYILVAVTLLIVTLAVGLFVIKVVDFHMANISINMPQVDVHIDDTKIKQIAGARALDNVSYVDGGGDKTVSYATLRDDMSRHGDNSIYYIDPKNMSVRDKARFKRKANIYKMTLRDYKNWLLLFTDDIQLLPMHHRASYSRAHDDTLKQSDLDHQRLQTRKRSHK